VPRVLGTYLNISFRGCPELMSNIRSTSGLEWGFEVAVGWVSEPQLSRKYVGLVSHEKVVNEATAPNIGRGNGCCGRMVPAGSVTPGKMWTGITRQMSRR
jgi:hypothetical protein